MFERQIAEEEVQSVLRNGEEIESYPADLPYPSRLMLGVTNGSPLHLVAAYNQPDDQTIVITVYRPDPKLWSADFRKRSKP
jgi:Domain of unknown function (DUF4258)